MLMTAVPFYLPDVGPRLSNRNGFAFDPNSPYSSTVTFTFKSNGELQLISGLGTTVPSAMEWWSGGASGGIGSSYDVRCSEIISGPAFTAQAATVGTYIQMGSDRVWTLTSTAGGGKQIVARFQIVATGDTMVLAESLLTFSVENGLL